MLLRLKMFIVWLRRIGHCKGFGIQSPSAYSFVVDVVNCHTRYEAYRSLDEGVRLTPVRRKLGHLLYRLSKTMEGAAWFTAVEASALPYYISGIRLGGAASCALASEIGALEGRRALLADLSEDAVAAVERFMQTAKAHDLLIVLGIHESAQAYAHWSRMALDSRTSVGFDLYYCGVLFFDKRYKQEYIVNF
ncbi:hypothetical protein [Prevotella sp.]|uniref:hypothetical protein n=1 Tax=Prevotella sp. TaxID=59823 RepID=UPI002F94C161